MDRFARDVNDRQQAEEDAVDSRPIRDETPDGEQAGASLDVFEPVGSDANADSERAVTQANVTDQPTQAFDAAGTSAGFSADKGFGLHDDAEQLQAPGEANASATLDFTFDASPQMAHNPETGPSVDGHQLETDTHVSSLLNNENITEWQSAEAAPFIIPAMESDPLDSDWQGTLESATADDDDGLDGI